ncbi:MAG TPA: HK97 family phage prohead protease [Cellvibrionaceae bacterium]
MPTKQRLNFGLSIKSLDKSGEFEAYGSVFGVKDSQSDIVVPGAFQKSLGNWRVKNRMPAMLWQHKMDEPIGIYTDMQEDENGLYMKGQLLIDDDPLAKRAYAHMKAGSLTGFSIGYNLVDWEYDKTKEAYLLKEIDLWEVSIVTFASNDEARLTEVKNILGKGEIPPPSKIEKALREVGFSISQAKTFMAKGYSALANNPRDAEVQSAIEIIKSINF